MKNDPDQLRPDEIGRRLDAALKKSLQMKPKPHKQAKSRKKTNPKK